MPRKKRNLAALKIAMTGLPPDSGAKFPSQLSGGMKKRAGLARARDNADRLPELAWRKLCSEVWPQRLRLLPYLPFALLGLWWGRRNAEVRAAAVLLGGGLLVIMLTHAIGGRFLVPYLPAFHFLSAIGAWRAFKAVQWLYTGASA